MYAIVGLDNDRKRHGTNEVVWGTGETIDDAWQDARHWIAEYVAHPYKDTEEVTAAFNAEIDKCREVSITPRQAQRIKNGKLDWPLK